MDITTIVYLIILVSLGINIAYMVWWTAVYKKVSTMFGWIAVLFIAMGLRYSLSLCVRIMGADWYRIICNEWWWELKDVPVAIASIAVCIVFTYRFTGGKNVH